jgi:hypothetical protein
LGPSCLASVQDLGRGKVAQVLVVREDFHPGHGSLKVPPPPAKTIHDGEKLLVVDFVVYLGRG